MNDAPFQWSQSTNLRRYEKYRMMDLRHRQITPFMHISYWTKKNQLLFISICTSCRFLPNPRMRGQRLVYQIQNDFLGVLFFRISRISNAAPCGKSHGGTPPQLISYRRSMPPFLCPWGRAHIVLLHFASSWEISEVVVLCTLIT